METTAVLERRAAQGDADALFRSGYRLGLCEGEGVGSSRRGARYWLTKAAAQHHRAAKRLLTRCASVSKGKSSGSLRQPESEESG